MRRANENGKHGRREILRRVRHYTPLWYVLRTVSEYHSRDAPTFSQHPVVCITVLRHLSTVQPAVAQRVGFFRPLGLGKRTQAHFSSRICDDIPVLRTDAEPWLQQHKRSGIVRVCKDQVFFRNCAGTFVCLFALEQANQPPPLVCCRLPRVFGRCCANRSSCPEHT